jgi:hypothetical protein
MVTKKLKERKVFEICKKTLRGQNLFKPVANPMKFFGINLIALFKLRHSIVLRKIFSNTKQSSLQKSK